jgi:chromosome segregation ATPase
VALQEQTADLGSARNRIDQLEAELAERNAQLQQIRAEERPFDLAEFNRPPPDVTQYQGVPQHPDVAHHPTASVQPDIMPQYTFQGNPEQEQEQQNLPGNDIPFYQMFPEPQGAAAAEGGDGWNDAGWGDPDDWFAGVQPGNQPEQQQQQLPELFQQHNQQQQQHQFVEEPLQQAVSHEWRDQEQEQQQQQHVETVSVLDYNSLREQLNVKEGELVSFRDSLAQKNEECSRLENDLVQLRSDSEHLKQMLNVKEEECSGLKSNLAQLKADQDLVSSSYAHSMEELRSHHSNEIETVRSEAKRIGQDKEALEAELEISEQECSNLKSSLAQVIIFAPSFFCILLILNNL